MKINDNIVIFIVITVVLIIAIVLFLFPKKDISPESQFEETTTSNMQNAVGIDVNESSGSILPEMILNPTMKYYVVLNTNKGDIKLALNSDSTPIAVNNFVTLAKKGFYNNLKFRRVIKGFMIQSGDPNGDGTGGPGYKFNDEPFTGEYLAGTLAMANSGPNTNGSQFFIMHKDTTLQKKYVIFGKVANEESMKVVDNIANVPVSQNSSGENSYPVEDVVIKSTQVITEPLNN